jgi:hypothetical protein
MNLLSTGAAGSSDGGSIDRLTLSNGERRGNLFTQRVSESEGEEMKKAEFGACERFQCDANERLLNAEVKVES